MDDFRADHGERRTDAAAVTRRYIEAANLTGRLHRQFLDLIKAELDRAGIGTINNVQAMILFSIGHDEMAVGDLTARGHYLGTNVSYNVSRMVQSGHLLQTRSKHDRRSLLLKLTDKGHEVRALLVSLFERHAAAIEASTDLSDLVQFSQVGAKLDRFWLLQLGQR
ncbi:MarR family winged helix-turn-helix transcriptional regulator [Thalassobaculum sp.]|uniref:MarR family winged helix-turn-helix transcriptional regulator n=1 Tax=Thalassobaculum sp. TaxID=2022740 RepID=UPI0032EC2B39